METNPPAGGTSGLAAASGRLAHRLFVICENRLQLVHVEMQEERQRLLRVIWLTMAVGVFGLLTGITLTFIIAVVFWDSSPVLALVILGILYATAGGCLLAWLWQMQKNWQTLTATIEQLRKDRECLEKIFDAAN